MMKIEKGSRGFSKEYWDKNYSEPEDMDGVFNAKNHALYLKNFFDLENVEVNVRTRLFRDEKFGASEYPLFPD